MQSILGRHIFKIVKGYLGDAIITEEYGCWEYISPREENIRSICYFSDNYIRTPCTLWSPPENGTRLEESISTCTYLISLFFCFPCAIRNMIEGDGGGVGCITKETIYTKVET
jgi:hypothetical protein